MVSVCAGVFGEVVACFLQDGTGACGGYFRPNRVFVGRNDGGFFGDSLFYVVRSLRYPEFLVVRVVQGNARYICFQSSNECFALFGIQIGNDFAIQSVIEVKVAHIFVFVLLDDMPLKDVWQG